MARLSGGFARPNQSRLTGTSSVRIRPAERGPAFATLHQQRLFHRRLEERSTDTAMVIAIFTLLVLGT